MHKVIILREKAMLSILAQLLPASSTQSMIFAMNDNWKNTQLNLCSSNSFYGKVLLKLDYL